MGICDCCRGLIVCGDCGALIDGTRELFIGIRDDVFLQAAAESEELILCPRGILELFLMNGDEGTGVNGLEKQLFLSN